MPKTTKKKHSIQTHKRSMTNPDAGAKEPALRVYVRPEHKEALAREIKESGLNYTQYFSKVLDEHIRKLQNFQGRTEIEKFLNFYDSTKSIQSDDAEPVITAMRKFVKSLEKEKVRTAN